MLTAQEQQNFRGSSTRIALFSAEKSPVRPEHVLKPQRTADIGQSLWKTFNVIQESLVRGLAPTA